MHNVAIDTKPLFEEQSQLYVTCPFVVKLTETESVRRIHFAVEDRKMISSGPPLSKQTSTTKRLRIIRRAELDGNSIVDNEFLSMDEKTGLTPLAGALGPCNRWPLGSTIYG